MDLALSSYLQDKGHAVHCVTYQSASQSLFLNAGHAVTHIPDQLPNNPLPQGDALDALDSKYQKPGLPLMVNSDILLRKGDYQEGLRIIVNHLRFWEQFFERKQVDVLLMYVTAYRVGRTAYAVARSENIPCLIIQSGPTPNRFTLCDKNEDWVWTELLHNLEAAESIRLSPEERGRVQDAVRQVSTFKDIIRSPRPSWRDLIKSTQRAVISADPIQRNEWRKVCQQMLWWRMPGVRLRYDPIQENDDFVFFPLHAAWDAQILTRNPLFHNQLVLAEQAALSLPAGYNLYVKEHPYNAGGEHRNQLQAIQRIHNVRLIDPRVNSKLLIQKSAAVFAINGTAGWEAFLLKKPVLVIGKPFYRHSSLVYPVQRLDDLPDVMRESLTEGSERYEAETDKWFGFIHHAVNTSYPGNPWGYMSFWGGSVPADLTRDNVRRVAESIHGKIGRRERGPKSD